MQEGGKMNKTQRICLRLISFYEGRGNWPFFFFRPSMMRVHYRFLLAEGQQVSWITRSAWQFSASAENWLAKRNQ